MLIARNSNFSLKEYQEGKINMEVKSEDLKYNAHGDNYEVGYRTIFFYDNSYSVSAYCPTIPGFMIGLCEVDPIMDDDEIPPFVSVDDLLERNLKFASKDVKGVGLYNVDGTCIGIKMRSQIKEK